MAVKIQIEIFWSITPCSPVGSYQRFGGTYHLHLQGRRSRNQEGFNARHAVFPFILWLAECPQCYRREIRQMRLLLTNLHCPNRPDYSIRIVEYHRKKIPKPNVFTETRTQGSFRVCDLSSCNLRAETNNFDLGAVLLSGLVSELQKPPSPVLELGQIFGVFTFLKSLPILKE
jgi:hypothetical protein